MVKIAIILVHLGEEDVESKRVLDIIAASNVKGISKILATDPSTQNWLKHNSKGVVVTKFPSFLVAYEGRSTQVYSADEVNVVIDILKEVT